MSLDTKIEIFCGTGGVGKTTLSFCRALNHANNGKKTLILTIDPAVRLKDFISQNQSNENLDVLIFDPLETFNNLNPKIDLANNRILKLLMSRYGGMNEILSLVEVSKLNKEGKYDLILLDTPPGRHFLDFLNSTKKIKSFFSKTFIEVLNYITDKGNKPRKTSLFKAVIETGVDKLMGYLEKVTGASFIKDFLEAVSVVYELKASFLETLNFNDVLTDPEKCQWFLVTSSDQRKYEEAQDLISSSYFSTENSYSVINKSNKKKIEEDIDRIAKESPEYNILKAFLNFEKNLENSLAEDFRNVISFEEIISNDLEKQVSQLTEQWNIYGI